MVSRNEIRVGNWLLMVFDKEKNSKILINYQPMVIREKDFISLPSCLPITLTIKLLGKCGFIYEGGAWCKYTMLNESREMVMRWKEKEGWLVGDRFLKIQPFYLHQLQNLYYALTGEELRVGLDGYKAFDHSTLIL